MWLLLQFGRTVESVSHPPLAIWSHKNISDFYACTLNFYRRIDPHITLLLYLFLLVDMRPVFGV